MRLNTNRISRETTFEGAPAESLTPLQALRRSVMSCMLWESEFYESGKTISERIAKLVHEISDTEAVAAAAIDARLKENLRHVPLLIAREMARNVRHKRAVSDTLAEIVCRPDELAEFLAIYWKDGREKVSAQVKKGLARAFGKFSEYQFAKYDRKGPIRLRDVLFICHAKPKSPEQDALWKRLISGTLETPDTWEVALSSGADKRQSWERLLDERKLGALALLRNLRNMIEVGVDRNKIRNALGEADVRKVLPFRFIAAAQAAFSFEPELESAMFRSICEIEPLAGKTVVLVDVSGSMNHPLSMKSDMNRIDAACGVAMILRELCRQCDVFSFSEKLVQIPPRRGFALRDSILSSQPYGSTELGGAVSGINCDVAHDRLIVITDEQSQCKVPGPKHLGYMINVASAKNGVGYRAWTHIDGFSENVVRFISEFERRT